MCCGFKTKLFSLLFIAATTLQEPPQHDFVEVETEMESDAVVVDSAEDSDMVKQRDEFLTSLKVFLFAFFLLLLKW